MTLPDPLPPRDECWSWGGTHRFEDGRPIAAREFAYRVTYRLFVGPIPARHHCHHTCHEPWCVNPWHIEPLSPREHARAHGGFGTRVEPGTWQRAKTTCPRGHLYDAENSHGRRCKRCSEAWKSGRKEWLEASGHLRSCRQSGCRPTCTAGVAVGTYHHNYD